MLRLPEFEYHRATTAAQAVALFHELGGCQGRGRDADWSAMYVAGGTDLLPNLKHQLLTPRHLIGLELPSPQIRDEGDTITLDAGVKLQDLADSSLIQRLLPPLAQAAGLVAGPQIRRMGTIGGNVLLDTRCLFYNQSLFWRQALGYCLKREGTWCHVVGGPKTCVAAQSSDCVPVLLGLDASIGLLGASGERRLRLRELYRFNGMDHLQIEPGELLTAVHIPKPGAGFKGSYTKLRTRGSIDFPALGLAVSGRWDGPVVQELEIVVGAVNPQPKPLRGLEEFVGRALDVEAQQAIAALVYKQTRPQAAVAGDVEWRRNMAAVFTRRALAGLV